MLRHRRYSPKKTKMDGDVKRKKERFYSREEDAYTQLCPRVTVSGARCNMSRPKFTNFNFSTTTPATKLELLITRSTNHNSQLLKYATHFCNGFLVYFLEEHMTF